jgi:hypothetical protein
MKTNKYFLIFAFILILTRNVWAQDTYSTEPDNFVINSKFSVIERVGFHDSNFKNEFQLPAFLKIPEFVEKIIKIARRPALITIGPENTALKNNFPNEFEFNKKNSSGNKGRRGITIKIISISF